MDNRIRQVLSDLSKYSCPSLLFSLVSKIPEGTILEAMDRITVIPFRDTEINILYKKGVLGYSFEYEGKAYGQKVTLQGRSVMDIVSATFLLFTSCMESYDALKKGELETKLVDGVIDSVVKSHESTS